MMEVIHRDTESYPFRKGKIVENTFVQFIKEKLSQQQIILEKQKINIYNHMNSTNLIKLVKIFQQNSTLHLFYQYLPFSFQMYADRLIQKHHSRLWKHIQKSLAFQFQKNLQAIIQVLLRFQIKTNLDLNNFSVVVSKETGNLILKLFVHPDSQYIQLVKPDYLLSLRKKYKVRSNRQLLLIFYKAEKKRILVESQELLKNKFGKKDEEFAHPNFVITGAKLVFKNSSEGTIGPKVQRNVQVHIENNCILRRLQEIPQKPVQDNHSLIINALHKNQNQQFKQNDLIYQRKINNVIRSFEADCKPEDPNKENASTFEGNEYRQSLQAELVKQAIDKEKQNLKSNKTLQDRKLSVRHAKLGIEERDKYHQRSLTLSSFTSQKKLSNFETITEKTNQYNMKIKTSMEPEIQEKNEKGLERQDINNFQLQRYVLIGKNEYKLPTKSSPFSYEYLLSAEKVRESSFKINELKKIDFKKKESKDRSFTNLFAKLRGSSNRNSEISYRITQIEQKIQKIRQFFSEIKIRGKNEIKTGCICSLATLCRKNKELEKSENAKDNQSLHKRISQAKQRAENIFKEYEKIYDLY